uniref:Uncharacterized protein n=1 Tax=Mus spicilegus TaxID=10103 RepID=A0A8C6MRP5_MUSSI
MWKASAGHAVSITQDDGRADDWKTDPDFVNDVSEKEQRWCAKTVQGSGTKNTSTFTSFKRMVDQSTVGFEYQGKTEKNASQKDYSSGFKVCKLTT